MPLRIIDKSRNIDEEKVKKSETKGDKLRKNLKKAINKKTTTSDTPMKMERRKEGFRSKNPGVKFMDEMNAMTKGLKTLTSEGPGRLKVGSFSKGGRAGFKMGSGKCKIAKKGKGRAYGKNS